MNKENIRNEARRLSNLVQVGSAKDVIDLRSPINRWPLHVVFMAGEKNSITISEVGGDFSICIDGLETVPPWVADLGDSFTTAGL